MSTLGEVATLIMVYNDGGRRRAGFTGYTGDCVTRSIAIATGKPYIDVYNDLFQGIKEFSKGRSAHAKHIAKSRTGNSGTTPRNGVPKEVLKKYLTGLGWTWTPTMFVGQGCKVHLRHDELPSGTLIISVSKHLTVMIDGVIHDTHNPDRGGTRCVYGYWSKA